ncbi:hypothetical protein WJX82_010940 [Trebouxia sp. C0006]
MGKDTLEGPSCNIQLAEPQRAGCTEPVVRDPRSIQVQNPVTYVSQQAFAMSAVQQEAPIVSNSIDDAGGDLAAPPASFGSTISVGTKEQHWDHPDVFLSHSGLQKDVEADAIREALDSAG